MDLTQLANLGEFVGGIAVLVTLVYLAIQVRQGAAAQNVATAIAAADAVRSNVLSFSAYRQMMADESTGEVWTKAQRDEPLTPSELTRLYAVVSELGWSAASTMETFRATGNEDYAETVASQIASELGQSAPMRHAWEKLSTNLRVGGFEELADGVSTCLDRG